MTENNNWQQQVWQQPQPQTPPQSGPQGYCAPQQPYYVAEPQKKGKGWIVGIVAILAIFLFLVVGMLSCSSAISSSMGSFSSLPGTTTSSADYLTNDAIGIIPIDGTIQYDGTTSSPEGLKEQLDKAEENSHIKAIVLRVNSGGGTATAGEEMTEYLKGFSKPVVVSSASMNASAAYEISSQADYIYTAKTTSIGSIGTSMSITDLSGLYEKLGIRIDDITSAESKNSSYGNRPLTEEERVYYQNMVDQINETFIETVAEGRGMSVEEVRVLATGLTFTGMTAVENGLADDIGTLEDAKAKAAELAGISKYTTVTLQNSSTLGMLDLLDIFGSSSSSEDAAAALKELTKDGAITR